MAICIYAPDETDFSANGLGTLTPISCSVEEESGGMYELELVQPIDDTLRWAQLANGCIIKAPVPVRESPLYDDLTETSETVERKIYKVYNTSVGVYMREGPGKSYKNFGYLKNGAEVVLLDIYNSNWYHVCVVNGGRVCYMASKYLTYSRSETEVVGTTAGHRVIKYSQSSDQLFRIYSVERDAKAGTVTARAMHVFYDLRGNIIYGAYEPEKVAMDEALRNVFGKLMGTPQHSLHIADGMTDKISGTYSYKNPVEAMLDPDDGILNQGKGLLLRDNFDVYILPQATRDSGVTIRRGKNLQGVTVTEDSSDVVTRIIPCGKDMDDKDLLLDGDGYVDSKYIGDYPFPLIQKIDYDVKVVSKDPDNETSFKSAAAAREKLLELANKDFEENGIDLISYSMKVDFVMLQNTDEYAEFASLQAVFLHDTVTVIDSMIGLNAKVRVNGYKWNCLTGQYDSVTLGEIQALTQMVYSYNLPTGGVSGTKIAPGTASGSILRDATIQYAKISVAAIEQLSAQAIVALVAHIDEIVAGEITTDALYAAFAELIALKAGTITADNITTDSLAAELARITVLSCGSATFDKATIQHLVAEAMNLEYGVAGQVFIKNLAVEYAQMVGATIGNLCIKASDGNYYSIDVDENGNVSATKTTVTEGEITAGETSGGRVILETNITAANLNTSNLLATYALINKIDAARIDVAELFAQSAFVDALYTSKIYGDKSIEMIVGQVNQNAEDIANLDSLDIYTGNTPPAAPIADGKLWIDTGVTPTVIRRWRGLDVSTDREYSIAGSAFSLSTIDAYFTISNGSGTSGWTLASNSSAGVNLAPGNIGVNSSTATITLKAVRDLSSVTITGAYYTETNYDKLTLTVAGTTVLNAVSGTSAMAQRFSGSIASGKEIVLKYVKDVSTSATNEANTLFTITSSDTVPTGYTASGWDTISDTHEIEKILSQVEQTAESAQDAASSAQDTAASAQDAAESAKSTADNALPRVEFQRVVRIDDEGLHVGDNQSNGEVLVDSSSVNVVFNGQKYSKFSGNYVQFGNYQLRRSSDGGLVFKLA